MSYITKNINARRAWLVPDVSVWGTAGLGDLHYLAQEQIDSSDSVYFGTYEIGETDQEIQFKQLVDHRGNNLPESISSPIVMIRSHSTSQVFIVGQESDNSFKIARDSNASGAVVVDLFILEMDG